MKRLTKIAVAFGLLFAANTAFAQYYDGPGTDDGTEDNTDAGEYVNNVATVTYFVDGVEQTAADNTVADGSDPDTDPDGAQFVVDRTILFTVANTSGDNVTPGQLKGDTPPPLLTFTVTNDSNDTLDFALSLADLTGDSFDATDYEIRIDDGDSVYDPVDDTGGVTATINDLVENNVDGDGIVTVFVIANIPVSATNTQYDDVVLVATPTLSNGDPIVDDDTDDDGTADTVDGALTVETVLGDAAGTEADDGVRDGVHSATGRYTVASASIEVTKSSVVLRDPFNETTNPKAIPGAEVLYCIEISNTGGETAENVSVRDPIPAGTTYVDESIRVFTTDITCAAGLELTGAVVTDDHLDTADELLDHPGISGNSGDPTASPAEATDTVVNTTVSSVAASTGVTATIFRVTVD